MLSTPRRSARIQGGGTEHQKPSKNPLPTASRLPTLIEREETPKRGAKSNLSALVSPASLYPVLQTPRTTARFPPSFEGAHPSKVQKSTAQQLDTGISFGFVDIRAGNAKQDGTPTKSNSVPTPGYEFQFNRPKPGLGPEAQQMMDELRGEAARIKKKLEAERDAERVKNEEQGSGLVGVNGRKIAPAKGKSGRFSDIHMAEFRKMDSIAGHPSAFRAQPGRFTPVTTSLKRTKSQAKLDDTHDGPAKSKSFRSIGEDDDGRLANTGQAKRVKTFTNEDTSTPQPQSQTSLAKAREISLPTTPSIPRSKSCLRKNPLARIVNIRRSTSVSTSLPSLKSLKHSPLTGSYPVLPGQESAIPRFVPHTLTSVHPVSTPKPKLNLSKDLPLPPSSPTAGLTRTATLKRVAFAPDTNFGFEPASPTPANKTALKSRLPTTIGYPTLPKLPPPSCIKASQPFGAGVFTFRSDQKLEFGSAAGTTIRQVMPSSSNDDLAKPESKLRFLATPHSTPNEEKRRHGDISSGNGLAKPESKLRFLAAPHSTPNEEKRRHGDISSGNSLAKPDSEFRLPAVLHGIPNEKKRRHGDISSDDEPIAKKIRGAVQWTPTLHQKAKEGLKTPRSSKILRTDTSGTGGKRRGVLSLSRLNVLATPKKRGAEDSGAAGGSGRAKGFWRTRGE
ncbi:MAG: hypothetical protein M1839_000695 [Geoglossum umbratile]|nr:MAG: hypothetical protein M1839_000695 [Geoglossum umbratile]